MTQSRHPNERQSLAVISNAMVRLHARHYGKGPTRARTFAFNDFVLCLLYDPFTTGEKTLIANGREQSVLANRLEFYAMLEDSFRAAVEEAIGRRTSAFLPQLKGDPPIVTALFLLQPEGG